MSYPVTIRETFSTSKWEKMQRHSVRHYLERKFYTGISKSDWTAFFFTFFPPLSFLSSLFSLPPSFLYPSSSLLSSFLTPPSLISSFSKIFRWQKKIIYSLKNRTYLFSPGLEWFGSFRIHELWGVTVRWRWSQPEAWPCLVSQLCSHATSSFVLLRLPP